jgi:hypothetical protein
LGAENQSKYRKLDLIGGSNEFLSHFYPRDEFSEKKIGCKPPLPGGEQKNPN